MVIKQQKVQLLYTINTLTTFIYYSGGCKPRYFLVSHINHIFDLAFGIFVLSVDKSTQKIHKTHSKIPLYPFN